jgi:hypothetical protein
LRFAGGTCRAEETPFQTGSLFLSRQTPGWMRLGAGQASAKLAFLVRLCATRGAADKQRWFLLGFHDHMMLDS